MASSRRAASALRCEIKTLKLRSPTFLSKPLPFYAHRTLAQTPCKFSCSYTARCSTTRAWEGAVPGGDVGGRVVALRRTPWLTVDSQTPSQIPSNPTRPPTPWSRLVSGCLDPYPRQLLAHLEAVGVPVQVGMGGWSTRLLVMTHGITVFEISRKRGNGRVTTPATVWAGMASHRCRHSPPSSRMRSRALPGSRHPQPHDQSPQQQQTYFQY